MYPCFFLSILIDTVSNYTAVLQISITVIICLEREYKLSLKRICFDGVYTTETSVGECRGSGHPTTLQVINRLIHSRDIGVNVKLQPHYLFFRMY
jgi:hypothetical protein